MKNQNAGVKNKAFTLIELLVVIAIIALLLAILVPSLQKARDVAYRIRCGSNLKNIAAASYTYTNLSGEYYVPAGHLGANQPAKIWPITNADYTAGGRYWYENETFRKYLNIDDFSVKSTAVSVSAIRLALAVTPKQFLCPADKVAKNAGETGYRMSYAYNNTDFRPWTIAYTIVGYKASAVPNPAGTLNFIDAADFWVDINGAHYVYVWDKIKGMTSINQWPDNISGDAALYRHNEGANIGFYDGHAQWVKKEECFDREGYNAKPAWMGMWTATGRIIPGWNKRWPN
jgi:prepilin-type N-terminal cleavage/methylation domain-containing protein/prepilin-type processing-associated H-X9-DG protein